MKIYCFNSASKKGAFDALAPKEYLTLPAGEKKNYAEIYNKR